jgi:hypothetical protein
MQLNFLVAGLSALAPVLQEVPQLELEASDGRLEVRALGDASVTDFPELQAAFVRIRGAGPAPAEPAGQEQLATLFLTSGERLIARVDGGAGETLELALLGGVRAVLAVDDLSELVFPARLGTAGVERPAQGDLLLWAKSSGLDRVEGRLVEFGQDRLRFEGRLLGGQREVSWSEVAALAIEPLGDGAREKAGAGAPIWVELVDGSRLAGGFTALSREHLALRSRALGVLELPLSAVVEIGSADGRTRFVSEFALEFERAREGTPFGDGLGLEWPPKVDRNVLGGPLAAGGRSYSRGLGVHAPSRVALELGGRWKSLRGAVALDDSTRALAHAGSVRFRVLVDGQVRYESPVLRGGDAPLELPAVDVADGRQLVLEVDDGGDGHVADRANWLRLRLVQ